MNARRVAALLTSILLLAASLPARGNDDTFQAWYQTTVWHRINSRWSVGTYLDLRVNDGIDDVHTWIVSPRLRYDVNPNLQLQVNTSRVEAFNAENIRPVDSFRLEIEANPTLPLAKSLIFSMRNRFEWRWIEGGAEFNTRLRIRPQLDWLVRSEGLFRGFFANHETFWDFDQHRITETRFVPFGLILKPADAVELRISYLWRQTAGRSGWYGYHAAVAAATISF
ncbi:MAG TPA: DUF2490 domain-containing protein [Prosthecobacter sp.]|nr:DUF2490 domain-containing protein [Prosthecobacter sp.]